MNPSPILRSLRPKQWTKNAVVLAALIFAMGDSSQALGGDFFQHALLRALAATLLFCMASSAVYLMNDLRDVDLDRAHPVKRLRPLAAGQIEPGTVRLLSFALLTLSLLGAWYLDQGLAGVLTTYLLLQIAYTFGLKRIALLDIFIIATGFVLRALAGGVVIHVPISPWLLVCTFLLALFLALCKRRHELVALTGQTGTTRPSLQQYDQGLLDALIPLTGSATLVCYGVYTLWPDTVDKFGTTHLAFTIPVVAFGLFRYLDLVYRHEQGGRPEQLLLTDPPLLATVAIYGLAVVSILLTR